MDLSMEHLFSFRRNLKIVDIIIIKFMICYLLCIRMLRKETSFFILIHHEST